MTAIITYTHADATTLDFDGIPTITWIFPNKTIERQNNKIGITCDPNQVYRVVQCTAILTSTQLDTLNTMMMPSTAPTYDATDPKIRLYRDGTNYYDILCAVITPPKATHVSDNRWSVQIEFTERTT